VEKEGFSCIGVGIVGLRIQNMDINRYQAPQSRITMNKPPKEYTSVASEDLRRFASAVFQTVGMPASKADFLSDLLVTNDLRGVFSHGTVQVVAYARLFREGHLTPDSHITTVSETSTTLVLDGGGGLGYFPCYELATRLIPKAKEHAIAVGTTRYHGHFGAAGIYARLPLAEDLFCYVTSGHQLDLHPGNFAMRAAGGSPMAFAIPTGEEPPFVLDFGAAHDLYIGPDRMREVMELLPSAVLRSYGLGCACQALGGLLCGLTLDIADSPRERPQANQGSMMIVVDLAALTPIDAFKKEMDAYSRRVRELTPIPGVDEARLPGGVEWEREQRHRVEGVPVSPEHAKKLRQLSDDYGVPLMFALPD
jgi:L-2-hydroxycarboxylate dehydrogenase (NAD+)